MKVTLGEPFPGLILNFNIFFSRIRQCLGCKLCHVSDGENITCWSCYVGHEFLRSFSAFVFISLCSTTAKPGVNPHDHMILYRKWGSICRTVMKQCGFPDRPTGSHSSWYRASILSSGASLPCCSSNFKLLWPNWDFFSPTDELWLNPTLTLKRDDQQNLFSDSAGQFTHNISLIL